jgi:hypothetical protein
VKEVEKVYKRCQICDGVTTCPEGKYLAVRAPREEEVLMVKDDSDPGEGWVMTHYTFRYAIWVRTVGEDGYFLHLIGSEQRGRVWAHYRVSARWVGRTTYAIYVVPAPGAWPPDYFPRTEKG